MKVYSDYIFPKFFDLIVKHKGLDDRRSQALSQARGKILDIGIGTGINLDFYPKHVTEICAIDPNPGMERRLREKLKDRPIKVHFTLTGAEQLPFENETFDTVVSTITMCSIPNLSKALGEIKRVLKPNGQLIFLDHGLSRDPRVARRQHFLNPFQSLVGCGCKLTVDVEAELKRAEFKLESLKNYYVENSFKHLGHVYDGTAIK